MITSIGVVSPFGAGEADLATALEAGRSAVAPIAAFDASALTTRVAAEVPDLGPPEPAWTERGWTRDRKTPFGLVAARRAWRNAGCDKRDRTAALSIGLGLEQALLEDFDPVFDGVHLDLSSLPAGASTPRFRTPLDLCARAIATDLGLTGRVVINASACAAGTLAVAHAAARIRRGQSDVVLCGAADSMINPLGVGGMMRLGAPSPRAEVDACRPFDRRRDGLVLGEGAAFFIVESADRAAARGARPIAEIIGWGSSQDAFKVTAPRPDGLAAARAMQDALTMARVDPGDVAYVNAHGTGTRLNDPAEVLAMRHALGAAAESVPISSIKGSIGHAMAAAGAIELAATLLAMQRGCMPPTANLEFLDETCDLDIIHGGARAGTVGIAMTSSFGFGGQNATLLLRRWVA